MRLHSGISTEPSYALSPASPTQNALAARRPTGLPVWLAVVFLTLGLAGCGGLQVAHDYPTGPGAEEEESDGSIFDWLTLDLFGADSEANDTQEGDTQEEAAQDSTESQQAAQTDQKPISGLSVNADLWRAALDTVRFMPLASADPTGGTIITDWYNDAGTDNERVKINIVISGLDLRADALRVSLFREKWDGRRWLGVAASSRAERQMENIILTRARAFTIMRRDAR